MTLRTQASSDTFTTASVPWLFARSASSGRLSLAAEMTAYDPTNGEPRTHYAGFFDLGFGLRATGRCSGREPPWRCGAHDVKFAIQNRQKVCKLTLERMVEEPERL